MSSSSRNKDKCAHLPVPSPPNLVKRSPSPEWTVVRPALLQQNFASSVYGLESESRSVTSLAASEVMAAFRREIVVQWPSSVVVILYNVSPSGDTRNPRESLPLETVRCIVIFSRNSTRSRVERYVLSGWTPSSSQILYRRIDAPAQRQAIMTMHDSFSSQDGVKAKLPKM
jgi:hypothetical protein